MQRFSSSRARERARERQDYDGANRVPARDVSTPPLSLAPAPSRLPCQMKRQKSSWKMKYANDVASVVVLTAELTRCLSLSPSLALSLFYFCHFPLLLPPRWLRHCFAKTTGGALNDAPATLSTSYAMAALQGPGREVGRGRGRGTGRGGGSASTLCLAERVEIAFRQCAEIFHFRGRTQVTRLDFCSSRCARNAPPSPPPLSVHAPGISMQLALAKVFGAANKRMRQLRQLLLILAASRPRST